MNPEQTNENTNVPDLSNEEYTMPKETFGEGTMTETTGNHGMIIALSIILILLLAILGTLLLWGEEIMETFLNFRGDATETQMLEETENTATTTETTADADQTNDLNAIEAELENDNELQQLDAELNEIDATLETSATTTTATE